MLFTYPRVRRELTRVCTVGANNRRCSPSLLVGSAVRVCTVGANTRRCSRFEAAAVARTASMVCTVGANNRRCSHKA